MNFCRVVWNKKKKWPKEEEMEKEKSEVEKLVRKTNLYFPVVLIEMGKRSQIAGHLGENVSEDTLIKHFGDNL